jgi:hypothetical protein
MATVEYARYAGIVVEIAEDALQEIVGDDPASFVV